MIKYVNYIYLIIAIFAFSTYEVTSKFLPDIDSVQLTFVRFLIGGLVLYPFCKIDLKKRKRQIIKKDYFLFAILGFLLVAVSMNMMQLGLKSVSANLTALIFSSNPIFVALFSIVFYKERVSFMKIVGLVTGIAGVMISFIPFLLNISDGENFTTGILLILSSTVAFSIYTVLGKRIAIYYGSITLTSLCSIFGSILFIPFMLACKVVPFRFDILSSLPQLIYMSVFITGIAYFCYFRAIEKLDTGLASMTFFIKPVLAGIIAAIILGENFSMWMIAGLMVIIVGMCLVKKSAARQEIKSSN